MGTDPAFVCLDCSLVNRPALVKHDRVRAERDRLREALEQISTAKRSAGGLRLMAADALDAERS